MAAKKTKDDPVLANLRKLARAYLHASKGDTQALADGLRNLGAFSPREVKLLMDAAVAEALQDLESPSNEAVRSLLRDRLASRIVSEFDASHEEARWAVETWAKAFGNESTEPAASTATAKPALSWDDVEEVPAPSFQAVRTASPPATTGSTVPQPQIAASAPPAASQPQAAQAAPRFKPAATQSQPAATAQPTLSQPAQPKPEPAAAWPLPALSYSNRAEVENTSSTDGLVPEPIRSFRWNWGACCLGWIWLLFNGRVLWGILLLVGQFVPVISLVSSLWLGATGHQIAWRNRRFESVEEYISVQRAWAIWGIVLWSAILAICFAAFVTGFLHGFEQGRAAAAWQATHPGR